MQDKHENGVQRNIQDGAGHESDHAQRGFSFIAQEIVECIAAGHKRRGEENGQEIASGVRIDGLGAAERQDDPVMQGKGGQGNDRSEQDGTDNAGRSDAGSIAVIPCTQKAGGNAAGSLAEHEADRLKNAHEAENDAHGCAFTGSELSDERGVDEVIDVRDQHAQNGGDAQTNNKAGNGFLRHAVVLGRCTAAGLLVHALQDLLGLIG